MLCRGIGCRWGGFGGRGGCDGVGGIGNRRCGERFCGGFGRGLGLLLDNWIWSLTKKKMEERLYKMNCRLYDSF